jgi:hypothetical protein
MKKALPLALPWGVDLTQVNKLCFRLHKVFFKYAPDEKKTLDMPLNKISINLIFVFNL